ncbi:MAG TPA: PIN domain-containing protein, partial [Acidobacteriota bacterium]|nr:PIN domain-containing protein [Acidobacteriota bacterium]
SWGELAYGAQKSSFPETSMAVVDDFLRENGVALVELSREIMRAYAHERARLEKKGEGLDQFDLLIAATALAHSLILVTRNTKHFSRIEGLRLAGE